MWLVTTQGFYSAVAHRNQPDNLLIRARVRRDLTALEKQLPEAGVKGRIFEDSTADYPYRIILSREEWAIVVARLATSIDYANFKDAVKERQGKKRANTYMNVWTALLRLEPNMWSRRRAAWALEDAAYDRDDTLFTGEELFPLGIPLEGGHRTRTRRGKGKRR